MGVVLIIIHCLLVPLSWDFDYDAPVLTYPVISFVALEMLAGGVYLTLLWLIPRSRRERRLLALVLGVGFAIPRQGNEQTMDDDQHHRGVRFRLRLDPD